jgi:hypothetical protein
METHPSLHIVCEFYKCHKKIYGQVNGNMDSDFQVTKSDLDDRSKRFSFLRVTSGLERIEAGDFSVPSCFENCIY